MIASAIVLAIAVLLGLGFEVRRRRHARRVELWARTFGLVRQPNESIPELRVRVLRVMRGVARVDERRPPLRTIRGGRR